MKQKSDSNNTAGAVAQERLVRHSWCCPTCGIAQPMPIRHPLGTRVKHAKLGKGKIFSYKQCDDVSCVVDFGRKGQWCIAIRELIILPNAVVSNTGANTKT